MTSDKPSAESMEKAREIADRFKFCLEIEDRMFLTSIVAVALDEARRECVAGPSELDVEKRADEHAKSMSKHWPKNKNAYEVDAYNSFVAGVEWLGYNLNLRTAEIVLPYITGISATCYNESYRAGHADGFGECLMELKSLNPGRAFK